MKALSAVSLRQGRLESETMKMASVILTVVLLALTTPAGRGQDGAAAPEQTVCPVMEGKAIDRSLFTEHRGKRVYFCCKFCKGAFEKEPEKYLSKLPQFTGSRAEEAGVAHGHDHEAPADETSLRVYRFTKPLGIATFSLLLLTACAGFFRRKLKRRFLPAHRVLAVSTVVAALLHALTVLLGH
jgi:YHS domain-containing protein